MTSAVGRAVALLLVLATSFGCASADRRESQRRGNLLIDADNARALGYSTYWATDVPLNGSTVHDARVLGDLLVIVEKPSGLVSALSMRDGNILWRRSIDDGRGEVFSPTRTGDTILVNTTTRVWQLRARDGEVLRIFDIDRVVSTGAHISGDFALFGGIDGTVFAKILDTGVTRWEYRLSDHFRAPLLPVGGNILVADASGVYAMLSPLDGTLMWRGRTFGPIVAEPASDDVNVYIPSTDGTLYAIQRNTGRDRWTYRTEAKLTLPPESYGSIVILPIPNEGVVGLDPETGDEKWQIDDARALAVTQRGSDLILAGVERLMRVDAATGRIRAEGDTHRLAAIRAGSDGSLVLVSPTGRVLRLNPLN